MEFSNDLDGTIRQLERRIAEREHLRALEQGQAPQAFDRNLRAAVGRFVRSGAGMTVLAAVGERLAEYMKKDLKHHPRRLVLKGLAGAVLVGVAAKYFAKNQNHG